MLRSWGKCRKRLCRRTGMMLVTCTMCRTSRNPVTTCVLKIIQMAGCVEVTILIIRTDSIIFVVTEVSTSSIAVTFTGTFRNIVNWYFVIERFIFTFPHRVLVSIHEYICPRAWKWLHYIFGRLEKEKIINKKEIHWYFHCTYVDVYFLTKSEKIQNSYCQVSV